jgi:hypothetical protein
MKTLSCRAIALTAVMVLCSAVSYAQASIEKLVKSMESHPDVEMAFTERRNPDTKEVTFSYNTYVTSNTVLISEIEEKLTKERENSVQFEKYKNLVRITFSNGASYTLEKKGNKATLYVEKRDPAKKRKRDKSGCTIQEKSKAKTSTTSLQTTTAESTNDLI